MTATNNASTQNTTTNGNTNGSAVGASRTPRPLTAVDAIGKISKILDQLSPNDRKRVLDFVTTTNE